MQLRHVSSDDGRSGDVPVAHVSRVRSFAWIASWMVPVCLSSVVSSHAQAATPTPDGSAAPDTTVTWFPGLQDDVSMSGIRGRVVGQEEGRRHARRPQDPLDPAAINGCRPLSRRRRGFRRVLLAHSRAEEQLPDTPLDFPRAAHESNRALVHVPGHQVGYCRAQLPASTCDHLRDAEHVRETRTVHRCWRSGSLLPSFDHVQ